jgi:hypothetical protein
MAASVTPSPRITARGRATSPHCRGRFAGLTGRRGAPGGSDGGVDRVGGADEHVGRVRAEGAHRTQDHQEDQRNDQAVFDRGGAPPVAQER